jgi:hypothetical protein
VTIVAQKGGQAPVQVLMLILTVQAQESHWQALARKEPFPSA